MMSLEDPPPRKASPQFRTYFHCSNVYLVLTVIYPGLFLHASSCSHHVSMWDLSVNRFTCSRKARLVKHARTFQQHEVYASQHRWRHDSLCRRDSLIPLAKVNRHTHTHTRYSNSSFQTRIPWAQKQTDRRIQTDETESPMWSRSIESRKKTAINCFKNKPTADIFFIIITS